MPTQDLTKKPSPAHRGRLGRDLNQASQDTADKSANPANYTARRALVIGTAILITLYATQQMYLVLNGNGPSTLGLFILALFVTDRKSVV